MDTIQHMLSGIGEDFIACVEAIYNCKGRIVLTGIGKSALVAQKITATLNSTGTPSLFMHAADAIHGDLGMIRESDFVLCLSKSGETAEIKVLVPLIRHLGGALIGMVSNPNSFLAKQADYILHCPVPKEADPNNLAPTASTTAQMAMGDAIATSLLALRGFSPSDFAQFHPGGALGKQLYLKVSDIFPANEAPVVSPDTPLELAILEITSKRLGATAVVDDDGRVIGVITDGDLRRMLTSNSWNPNLLAKDIMTPDPITIQGSDMAVKALNKMQAKSITQLLVVSQQGQYLGVVHLHDLVKEGIV